MANILVTGANGFVGKYLCDSLTRAGHAVTKLTSTSGNIVDPQTWEHLPVVEVVIHLAAKTFVPDSWKNPALFQEVNVQGTFKALEYCRQNNAKLIYISSYLYGNPISLPTNEHAPVFTPNPYALSKKIAEEYCEFYSTAYGVNTVILRPFNIYGFGQSPSFLIPEIIQQALHNNAIQVKDLEPKRDYLFIDDFIDAIIQSIELNRFEMMNLGSGESFSVGELIAMVQHILGTNLPVISSNEHRKAEIMNTIADITKAATVLHWKPKISMEEGLRKIIQLTTNQS